MAALETSGGKMSEGESGFVIKRICHQRMGHRANAHIG
jgi:hypothetical protein